ncbi:hypothetical protein RJ40_00915 [Methanofollis aquaemaris]|uniref:SIR2-like domain-containing protein n=1 Tax=Methanofollis aquaemaris TaxID=126734 RepID=A0A8A3S2N6_9EURY|nr:SIR2 family protein [Methanofollis aquaemaris]QSZ66159.1 hypothetical protein RJ40_00915 [Methanofollis aquaemaris]
MTPDDVLPAAFAVVQSPKRYALLLGSGISRDAGIPTGWEITTDRIQKTAEGLGETIEGKPEDWYQKKYGYKPTFSNLFNGVDTPADREAALREYFTVGGAIPQPTEAHRTIATMVKEGLIGLIITTNFDDLMEQALRDKGISPVGITEGSDQAKMSVIPDQCRVIKVNGDYPNTSLKMTSTDLKNYNKKLSDYLKRIFSEYGLIVCGWSGVDDKGLVKILTQKRVVRRHSLFWCQRDTKPAIPSKIIKNLTPMIIPIQSADEFFGELYTRIKILRRYNRTESMTVATAVKKVCDALRDPRPDLILSDLINTETDHIYQELTSQKYLPEEGSEIVAHEYFKNVLEEFECLTAPLAAMTAMIAYYDDGGNTDLIVDAIERLINVPGPDLRSIQSIQIHDIRVGSGFGKDWFFDLVCQVRYYPALLVIYAAGIAAVKKGNLSILEAILARPKIEKYINSSLQRVPYHDDVNIWSAMAQIPDWILDFNYERYGQHVSVPYYLYRVVQSILQPIIRNELAYDGAFDTFEYLYGLSYLRLASSPLEGKSVTETPLPLLSRVWVNTVRFNGKGTYRFSDPVVSYLKDIQKKAEGSDFFGGDIEAFERRNQEFAEFFGIRAPETGIVYLRGGLL